MTTNPTPDPAASTGSADSGQRSHELKCWSAPFWEIAHGDKTAEFRKNDRGFQVGDWLVLRDYMPNLSAYSGWKIEAKVTAITTGYGIPEGYVMMSLGSLVLIDGNHRQPIGKRAAISATAPAPEAPVARPPNSDSRTFALAALCGVRECLMHPNMLKDIEFAIGLIRHELAAQQPTRDAPSAGAQEASNEATDYPRDFFVSMLTNGSPYAFYLFQWVPYQTEAKRWRLKMLHDVRTFDGREAFCVWPNGSSCGPFKDHEVEFIRISRRQWGDEWKDPRPEPSYALAARPAPPTQEAAGPVVLWVNIRALRDAMDPADDLNVKPFAYREKQAADDLCVLLRDAAPQAPAAPAGLRAAILALPIGEPTQGLGVHVWAYSENQMRALLSAAAELVERQA